MTTQLEVIKNWADKPIPPLPAVLAAKLNTLKPVLIAPYRKEDEAVRPLCPTNGVARIDLSCQLPFFTVFSNVKAIRRARVKFPQILRRYGSTTTSRAETLIMYNTGRVTLCGISTIVGGIRALQLLRLELHQAGIPAGLGSFIVVNVVVKLTLPFSVDIMAAHESKKLPNSSLKLSAFPGAIFNMRGVKVLVFPNGNSVFTGATDMLEMEIVRVQTEDALRPFALPEGTARPSRRSTNDGKRKEKQGPKKKVNKATQPRKTATASRVSRPRRKRTVARAVAISNEEDRVQDRRRGVAFEITENLVVGPEHDEPEMMQ